jgi:hypothetical protein
LKERGWGRMVKKRGPITATVACARRLSFLVVPSRTAATWTP